MSSASWRRYTKCLYSARVRAIEIHVQRQQRRSIPCISVTRECLGHLQHYYDTSQDGWSTPAIIVSGWTTGVMILLFPQPHYLPFSPTRLHLHCLHRCLCFMAGLQECMSPFHHVSSHIFIYRLAQRSCFMGTPEWSIYAYGVLASPMNMMTPSRQLSSSCTLSLMLHWIPSNGLLCQNIELCLHLPGSFLLSSRTVSALPFTTQSLHLSLLSCTTAHTSVPGKELLHWHSGPQASCLMGTSGVAWWALRDLVFAICNNGRTTGVNALVSASSFMRVAATKECDIQDPPESVLKGWCNVHERALYEIRVQHRWQRSKNASVWFQLALHQQWLDHRSECAWACAISNTHPSFYKLALQPQCLPVVVLYQVKFQQVGSSTAAPANGSAISSFYKRRWHGAIQI